jgi:hypothetical protein
MDPATEIAQLKAQVAALTQAVEALKFFLHIEPPGTKEGAGAGLHIRCTSLALCDPADPTNPQRTQALFSGGKEGPLLAMNGPNLEPRLTLSVRANQSRCELFGKDMKQAVLIHSEEASARGLVEVLEAGLPRAILRAVDNAGVVSVLHGEKAVRAVLRGDAKGADLQLLNTDQKVVVKATSDLPDGGSVIVNRKGGEAAILMACHEGDGTLVTLNPKKQVTCSLRSTPMGGALLLHAPDEKSTVSLYSTQQGGHVRVHGASGKTAAELTAEPHGGAVLVCDGAGKERAAMRMLPAGPLVMLRDTDNKPLMNLSAVNGTGALHLFNTAGAFTSLEMQGQGSRLAMLDEAKKIQLFMGHGAGRAALHLQPGDEQSSVVGIVTTEQGGVVMVSAADGIRRAGLAASADGGQVCVFNDLGIERALIGTMGDGGMFKLNWGGTPGVVAAVTEKGGLIAVNDADGNARMTMPPTVEE